MPSLLIVRHAQASFGAADYDVLSGHGRTQTAALAADLERRRIAVQRVITGSMVRQRDTAGPVARAVGGELTVDPRWNEYDSDDILSHHSTTDLRPDRPSGSTGPPVSSRDFQAPLEQALEEWIGAGEAGAAVEPYPAFARRVGAALSDAAAGLGSGETALVCTSGGVLAALCVALLGLPAPAFVPFNRVAVNAGISKVVVGRGGTTLVSFNEHAHLEQDATSLVTYR